LAGGSPPETIMCRAVSGILAPRGTSAAARLTFQAVVAKPDPRARATCRRLLQRAQIEAYRPGRNLLAADRGPV
jgi:hypothetical protein